MRFLNSELVRVMEQVAGFEGGRVRVLLLKGDHYLLGKFRRYVPWARDWHSGKFNMTIG